MLLHWLEEAMSQYASPLLCVSSGPGHGTGSIAIPMACTAQALLQGACKCLGPITHMECRTATPYRGEHEETRRGRGREAVVDGVLWASGQGLSQAGQGVSARGRSWAGFKS